MSVSINYSRIEPFNQAFESNITWEDILDFFNTMQPMIGPERYSVIGAGICNSEINEKLKVLKEMADSWHPGKYIDAMTIIHFENKTTKDFIPEEAKPLHESFRKATPDKMPNNFDYNLLEPSIHSDPVDGIFFQMIGTVTWRVYYEDGTEESHVLVPGDVMVVPKGINHSVESMEPRCSLSVSFADA